MRLPNGVFAPYTPIPTNLLFFDRSGPTKQIWYYEVPLPEGRRSYTKTMPLQVEEFSECIRWFQLKRRRENERAWCVSVDDVLQYDDSGSLVGCNLDCKNPKSVEAMEHIPPNQLLEDILSKERRVMQILEDIKACLSEAAE